MEVAHVGPTVMNVDMTPDVNPTIVVRPATAGGVHLVVGEEVTVNMNHLQEASVVTPPEMVDTVGKGPPPALTTTGDIAEPHWNDNLLLLM